MGALDRTEKTLEAYNDVFADIVNVLLFDGQRLVQEDDLQAESPRSMYKADENLHEQERDVAKYWKNSSIRIALLGFENQTAADQDMPLRMFGYDGASYRAQLLGKRRERYPVVSLVLYFGEAPWSAARTLSERLDIPAALAPYVNDYRINLFEISYLKEETIRKFQSDFGVVADYFVQKRTNKDYIPSEITIKHVDEFLKLMSAVTGDHRFEEIYSPQMKGGTTMCEILDRVENRGMERGMERGIAQGMERGLAQGEYNKTVSIGRALVKRGTISAEEYVKLAGVPKNKWDMFVKLIQS